MVSLSVFRRRKRKVLKANFHDGNTEHYVHVMYFELGGSDKRNMFWNLWCEKVKFLNPEDKSLTETSVGSSSSISSLHVVKTRLVSDQIWQYYEGANSERRAPAKPAKWTDRNLFFGETVPLNDCRQVSFSEMVEQTTEIQTLYATESYRHSETSSGEGQEHGWQAKHINRFGEGVDEKCLVGLHMSTLSRSKRSFSMQSVDSVTLLPRLPPAEHWKPLMDQSVELWESCRLSSKPRHPRKYGLYPLPHLYFGFTLPNLSHHHAFSLQLKKAPSLVTLPVAEFDYCSTRMRLCSSTSQECLIPWTHSNSNKATANSILRFWTTDNWFRPTSIIQSYLNVHQYFKSLVEQNRSKLIARPRKRKLFGIVKKQAKKEVGLKVSVSESTDVIVQQLQLDRKLSGWDIDSSNLAFQITMLDAQLFQAIPNGELESCVNLRCGINTNYLMVWLVFAQRVTCLVATEVVKTREVKCRARLVARFINAAEKCHQLHNYQSCRSILAGLQSPAVYRLHDTWTVVRQLHATRYRIFEVLCRLYSDPRLDRYQKSFYKASMVPPFLPSALHLFAVTLGLLSSSSTPQFSSLSKDDRDTESSIPIHRRNSFKRTKVFQKIISAIIGHPSLPNSGKNCASTAGLKNLGPLDPFFTSLNVPEQSKSLKAGEELLRVSQNASKKYDLGEHMVAKDFLLKVRYLEPEECFRLSLKLELNSLLTYTKFKNV